MAFLVVSQLLLMSLACGDCLGTGFVSLMIEQKADFFALVWLEWAPVAIPLAELVLKGAASKLCFFKARVLTRLTLSLAV